MTFHNRRTGCENPVLYSFDQLLCDPPAALQQPGHALRVKYPVSMSYVLS